ncbi:MAG: hypothetical protein KAX49_16630, partial [Halanaerobiales bacterium]|nr:hypothetical protein [Halanaerobiales bacterium]
SIKGSFNREIVAGNRLYTVGDEEIGAYKLSDLSKVWSYKAVDGQSIILSNHHLYAVADRKLYKFDGETNVYAPETNIFTKPEAPTGENGYFNEDVNVYLEATDRDNEVMVTYYSIDGGNFEPFEKSIVLTDGEHQISYYSMDEEYKLEEVKRESFKIDSNPPVIRLITDPVDGNNGYYLKSSVNVSMEATDVVSGVDSLYYKVDGGEEENYTEPFIVAGDGRHVIEYYGKDVAGNWTKVMSSEILIDTTAPIIQLKPEEIDGLNGYHIHEPVLFTMSGEDNFSGLEEIYYQIDGQGYQRYMGVVAIHGEGSHRIEFYGVDQAGNPSQEITHELKIDTTALEITLTADEIDGLNGYYIKDSVNVWLSVIDNVSGIDQLYYRIDGGDYQAYENEIVVEGEADHVVEYYAVDIAGNKTDVMKHDVKIDHTVPELTFTPAQIDGNNGYYKTAPVKHELTATDNVSGVDKLYYQIADQEYQVYVDGIRVNGDGIHEVSYYGVDKAGNETEIMNHSFLVDTTAPLTIVERVKPLVNGLAANIRLTVTDNYSGVETIHYRIDDGEMFITQGDVFATTSGEHTVTYYAEDKASNFEEAKEVSCYVKSLDEINFIENIEFATFHNALTNEQPWEIDRKVEIDELIYLDDDYRFEYLPEYLTDARYIRANRHANKVGSNEYYLEFKSLISLQVYLMVDKGITSIPGYQLVENYRLADKKHFSEGVNVFVKQVSGNSEVRIPGYELLQSDHAPLVFIKYDESESLPFACIEEIVPVKRDGQWYFDFQGYGYNYSERMIEGTDLEWSYAVDDVKTVITNGGRGILPVQFREEPYLMEFTFTVTNSDGIQSVSTFYLRIVDQSGVYILEPNEMNKFYQGEEMILSGEKLDEMGFKISGILTWEWKHDEATGWEYVGTGEILHVLAPERKGGYRVRVSDGGESVEVKIVVQDEKSKEKGKK